MTEDEVVRIASLVNRRDRYIKTSKALDKFVYKDNESYIQADSIIIQDNDSEFGTVVEIQEEEFDVMNELVIKLVVVLRQHIREIDNELSEL